MTRRVALFLALSILLSLSLHAGDQTVTIESAQRSEYVKTGEGGEPGEGDETGEGGETGEDGTIGEVVRFSGNVVIVVKENESVSRICADEIVYDKVRDTIEARGNVSYEHTTGKTGAEKFRGELFLFNLKKQEGIFLGGTVEQDSGSKKSDPYIVHAEVTGKDSSSTMAFKKGVLTTCDAEDPHWSINATRIWLLPGNEIALLNGIFFIGPLPVFYIPFFYYPSDEMIFHPVFGFRNREGYFVQTTTYVYGRKSLPPDTGSGKGKSFSDFLSGDTLKEQKREGFFLQNLKEDAKSTDPDYMKIFADTYSSLGTMVGLDGSFTTSTFLKSVSFYGYAGFSKTLYPPESGLFYSTFDKNGEENRDSGWFFGNELPFRYRTNLSLKIDKSPLQVSLNVPLVSDPSFKPDFLDRSEDLNWFTLLTDQDKLALGTDISDESSFSWNASGTLTPKMSFTSPLLETASIQSLSGTITFNSKTNSALATDAQANANSPERKFFYPEKIKPELRLSFGGTLFSTENKKKEEPVKTENAGEKPDLSGIENPFAPKKEETQDVPDGEIKADVDRFMPSPGLKFQTQPVFPASVFTVAWTLNPRISQETTYNHNDWKTPEDIDWEDYSLLFYQMKTDATLKSTWTYDADLFSVTSSLDFSGTRQDHPYYSETVYNTQKKIDELLLADYKANVYTISTTDTAKYVPFNRISLLKPVAVEWNFTGKLYETVFDGTVDEPSWEKKEFEWEKEYITTHTAKTVAGVSIFDQAQTVSVTSNLPPLLEAYKGDASFGWTFVRSTFSSKVYEKEDAYKKWFWDPFTASVTWTLPFGIKLGQEYVYDIEEETHSRLNFTASKGFLAAEYTFTNTVPYKLVEGSGWVFDGTEKEFIPSSASLKFNNSSDKLQLYEWKNRVYLDASLSSNLKFDLLRPTSSSFDFAPKLTLKIAEFLDLTFESNSTNEVIARYFQEWIDLPAPLPGETNLLKDLVKSFNYADQNEQRLSGFKLKSLTLGITHYLHDWTAKFNTTIKPKLKTDDVYRYEFEPEITFVVEWKPISDIKTTVKSKEGVFTLNTTDDETTTTTTTTGN